MRKIIPPGLNYLIAVPTIRAVLNSSRCLGHLQGRPVVLSSLRCPGYLALQGWTVSFQFQLSELPLAAQGVFCLSISQDTLHQSCKNLGPTPELWQPIYLQTHLNDVNFKRLNREYENHEILHVCIQRNIFIYVEEM